jgi:hypothetical protein
MVFSCGAERPHIPSDAWDRGPRVPQGSKPCAEWGNHILVLSDEVWR